MNKKELIKIFISCPIHSINGAKLLKRNLEMYGSSHVKVFLAADIPEGSDWRRWVTEKIDESNLMISIFTGEPEQLKWNFYEAGLYSGKGLPESKNFIVFQQPHMEIPSIFEKYQAIDIDPQGLQGFLRRFFSGKLIPQLGEAINVNFALDDEEINRVSKEIHSALSEPFSFATTYYSRDFVLILNQECIDQLKENGEIPTSAKVSMNSVTENFLGLEGDIIPWKILKDIFQERGEPQLIGELNRMIVDVVEERNPKRITSTFRANFDGKLYRPFLYSNKISQRELRFRFILVEELSPVLIGGPTDSGTLFMLLRLSLRMKWEVIEAHLKKLDLSKSPESIKQIAKNIRATMDEISRESASHGFLVKEVVTTIFENEIEMRKIETIMQEWHRDWQRLVKSIEMADGNEIKNHLIKFRDYNDHFTSIVARRYSEMVRV